MVIAILHRENKSGSYQNSDETEAYYDIPMMTGQVNLLKLPELRNVS